jgi:hypothetical protein
VGKRIEKDHCMIPMKFVVLGGAMAMDRADNGHKEAQAMTPSHPSALRNSTSR